MKANKSLTISLIYFEEKTREKIIFRVNYCTLNAIIVKN